MCIRDSFDIRLRVTSPLNFNSMFSLLLEFGNRSLLRRNQTEQLLVSFPFFLHQLPVELFVQFVLVRVCLLHVFVGYFTFDLRQYLQQHHIFIPQ
eukprot:TRINITY_DN6189_c0_g1_i3.p2 TRINITY_DN6189_c0_g1~~TRINITY_DN6189_c0_g1_i3.p2  ORF type:complete len:110 (-),score=6.00 TRINITY_DN6189_c0_g1_i3:289-573(-)